MVFQLGAKKTTLLRDCCGFSSFYIPPPSFSLLLGVAVFYPSLNKTSVSGTFTAQTNGIEENNDTRNGCNTFLLFGVFHCLNPFDHSTGCAPAIMPSIHPVPKHYLHHRVGGGVEKMAKLLWCCIEGLLTSE